MNENSELNVLFPHVIFTAALYLITYTNREQIMKVSYKIVRKHAQVICRCIWKEHRKYFL